jgi:hypothetical protein
VDEAIVAAVDSEPVAELIAGKLRADGIPARVRYDSQAGIPRQIAPAGLGFGPGAFRVAVSARDVGRARELLRDAEPAPSSQRRVLKTVAAVLLALLLFSFLQELAVLPDLIGNR